MSDIQRELTLLRKAIEKLDRGLVLITKPWRVGLINDRARGSLAKYFGDSPSKEENLPKPLRQWISEQEAAHQRTDVGSPFKTLAVRKSGERLSARLVADLDQRILILREHALSIGSGPFEALGLTSREGEVLYWLTRGKSNEEIAHILTISRRTVGKHLEHIYMKFGVKTRTSATTFALSFDQ